MKAARLGVFSALIASACCLSPAVLVAVGLGGLGLGVLFARFSLALVVIAVVLLLVGWRAYLAERKRCAQAQCHMPGRTATLVTLGVASIIVAGFALMHLWPLATKATCAISCPR